MKVKKQVVEEVMLKFFNNDVAVLEKFIGTIHRKVKRSNVFRRLYRRAYNFFFLNREQLFIDLSAATISDLIWKLVFKRLIIIAPLVVLF